MVYYYVRKFIKSNAFIGVMTVLSIIYGVKYPWNIYNYNYDPWGRQFPLFVNGVISNYYDKNVVPQIILTTTSLDGVTVPCLDLIEA